MNRHVQEKPLDFLMSLHRLYRGLSLMASFDSTVHTWDHAILHVLAARSWSKFAMLPAACMRRRQLAAAGWRRYRSNNVTTNTRINATSRVEPAVRH